MPKKVGVPGECARLSFFVFFSLYTCFPTGVVRSLVKNLLAFDTASELRQ